MKVRKNLLLMLLALAFSVGSHAQTVAIKTNLLSDALLNVNAGMEIGLAPHWTLDLKGQYNGWTVDDKKWKHWLFQPGARYWFCDRFAGHFVGVHAHGGQFNIGGFDGKVNFLGTDLRKLKDTRYQGWFVGAGLSYGYAWVLGRHWNIEAEIGIGYSYTRYDEYNCFGCGKKVNDSKKQHNYVGPTKAAIDLVYLF